MLAGDKSKGTQPEKSNPAITVLCKRPFGTPRLIIIIIIIISRNFRGAGGGEKSRKFAS